MTLINLIKCIYILYAHGPFTGYLELRASDRELMARMGISASEIDEQPRVIPLASSEPDPRSQARSVTPSRHRRAGVSVTQHAASQRSHAPDPSGRQPIGAETTEQAGDSSRAEPVEPEEES